MSPGQFIYVIPCHCLSEWEAGTGFQKWGSRNCPGGWLAAEELVQPIRVKGSTLVACGGRCVHHALGYAAVHIILDGLGGQHN